MANVTFYQLEIGRKQFDVASLKGASEVYCCIRDKFSLGSSKMPEGVVWQGDIAVARVSYNGRVWPIQDWKPDTTPLYDNRI